MRFPPEWHGPCQDLLSPLRKREKPRALICRVIGLDHQPPGGQGLERGREGRAVHSEQPGHGAYRRGLWHIERHEEGELPIGEPDGLQRLIEAACDGTGSALQVQAEAGIADRDRGLEGDGS